MTRHEREAAERFAYLVESPYGLAAMKLTLEKFRRMRWGHATAREIGQELLFARCVARHRQLTDEVAAARARARGRA